MKGRFTQLINTKFGGISQVMALIGLILGTCILLLGVQWLFDLNNITKGDEGNGPFLTVNKPVSFLNSLGGPGVFSAKEIAEIREMDQVLKVAAFRSNEFKLRASVEQLGFASELFFESLPDDMLPEDLPADFQWHLGESTVPILIPKDYIALYNFGFAPSQGLPQVSPGLIEKFSFSLQMMGAARNGQHRGKIVGFTQQVNTILVPERFLTWANEHYSGDAGEKAIRLAVSCQGGQQAQLKDKLDRAGYEIGSSALLNEQASTLLRLAFIGIIGIGILIFLLAVYVANQYRQLVFTGQRENLQRLFEFGQDPSLIFDHMHRRFSQLIFIGLGGGLLLFFCINYLIKSWASQQGFDLSPFPHILVLMIGLLLLALIIFNQKKQLQGFLESCYNK